MKPLLLNKITFKRVLLHLLYWLGFIFYFSYFVGQPGTYWLMTKMTIYQLPFDIIVVYSTLYILIPRFFEPGKYILFVLSFIVICFVMIILQRLYFYEIIIPDVVERLNFNYWKVKEIFDTFKDNLVIYFVPVFYKIMNIWYKKKLETKQIQNKQIETKLKLKEAEVKLLKAQIHPHFLFNTLNNLYGLTIHKSDLAPEIVIRLSEILDYMLYECNTERVRLINEIKYIRNYIELEKIRYKKLNLKFIEKNISNNEMIAPLILLPFVENSFKHGVSKQINNAWININIKVENKELDFQIENSKISHNNQNQDYTKGIGLRNVKKRLELLYYNKYNLYINESEESFKVSLKIKL